ncbi:MAG: saccharopine dehydrogenase family protein [Promethearchaeota archaeon]
MGNKVVVLGGIGVVGSVVTTFLSNTDDFDEIVIGDINVKAAEEMAAKLNDKVSVIKFDAMDKESIRNAIQGADVVVNCIGPYYKFEKIILSTVIEAGINYVDVCDDTGATFDALALDDLAKKAGVTALLGMGSSPGVTNLLAGYAANELLEECESIEMFHIHGGEANEGAGVIGHRFYCLSNDIPMFLDGKAALIRPEESAAHEEDVEFINLPGKYRVYPYPHPEPITLPMFLKDKGLVKVTNKGTVLPEKYYDLTRKVHACGLNSREPITLSNGQDVIPHDFATAYLIDQRDKILNEMGWKLGDAKGCVKIVVKGKKKKTLEQRTYVFSLVSEGVGKGQGLGYGTGMPAALGTILMVRGKVKGPGVVPPEACLSFWDFIELMKNQLSIDDKSEDKKSPLIFQSIDENGKIKTIEF